MSDPASQLPDCRQPLLPLHLFLHAFALCDIDAHADGPDHLSAFTSHRGGPYLKDRLSQIEDRVDLLAGQYAAGAVENIGKLAIRLKDRYPDVLARLEVQRLQPTTL